MKGYINNKGEDIMATRRVENKNNAYDKIENIVMNRVFTLENENAQLRSELTTAKAKLEVYERLTTISNSKTQLGFGPPIIKE